MQRTVISAEAAGLSCSVIRNSTSPAASARGLVGFTRPWHSEQTFQGKGKASANFRAAPDVDPGCDAPRRKRRPTLRSTGRGPAPRESQDLYCPVCEPTPKGQAGQAFLSREERSSDPEERTPAVRLANCVEKGTTELRTSGRVRLTCQCDLRLEGTYTAVLYPAMPLSDFDLAAHGMTPEAIQGVRALQFPGPPYESIYVLPTDGRAPRTRTTYQANFASIAALSSITKTTSTVTFDLEKSGTGVLVANLR
jgi:hypothetical protein